MRSPRPGRRTIIAAACTIALSATALAACSSDDSGDVDQTSAATPGPTSATSSVAPPTTHPGPGGVETTSSARPPTTVAPTVESTADRSEAPPESIIRVTAVRVEQPDDAGRERIVIDTDGGTPGYRLRYVDAVRIDGEPVLVEGSAFLELVLQSADPTGDQGLADAVAVELLPGQPILREVRFAYYLGSEITYAIGVADAVPFSVTTTDDQIVITFLP